MCLAFKYDTTIMAVKITELNTAKAFWVGFEQLLGWKPSALSGNTANEHVKLALGFTRSRLVMSITIIFESFCTLHYIDHTPCCALDVNSDEAMQTA